MSLSLVRDASCLNPVNKASRQASSFVHRRSRKLPDDGDDESWVAACCSDARSGDDAVVTIEQLRHDRAERQRRRAVDAGKPSMKIPTLNLLRSFGAWIDDARLASAAQPGAASDGNATRASSKRHRPNPP